jgi:phosphoribosyl 1,2-cyclic phosphodiesterase
MDFKMSVCMLASGSKGNAIYISDGETAVLVDAGLSGIEIERRLTARGISPKSLDAILVTHEHTDHVQGVGILSRRYSLPVYISLNTLEAASPQIGKIKEIVHFQCGSTFILGTLTVHPFSLSHDAEDPAGFTVSQNGRKIGIATDLGVATSLVKTHLQKCSLLILESNHDNKMLENGPYPWPVKQRIKSRTGHLSNEEAQGLLEKVHHPQLEHVILAHMSETNNTPQKALEVVSKVIKSRHTCLDVATQDRCGELLILK